MDYKRVADTELWQCCRKDDMGAYRELFHRYAPRLYKQAVAYIKDSMITEELVMDLLFTIWQKRHEPIMQGDVAAYLFRAMRNQVLKHLRKKIPETFPIETMPEDSLVEQRQADHQLLTSDNKRIYETSLLQLSPQRRKVFQLSREENLSYAEIAAEMNLSVNTVENYMVAALKTLRQGRPPEIITSCYVLVWILLS